MKLEITKEELEIDVNIQRKVDVIFSFCQTKGSFYFILFFLIYEVVIHFLYLSVQNPKTVSFLPVCPV